MEGGAPLPTTHPSKSSLCSILADTHQTETNGQDVGLSSVLRPGQHSIGYMGDGFYRSKDPTNSIKLVLKEMRQGQIKRRKQQNIHAQAIIETKKDIHKISTTSPHSLH